MKLKKVLSLVLGGVMALSMLTACGGDGNDTGTNIVETSVNKTIVQKVMAEMTAKTVGDNQYAEDLTGNESADEETVWSEMKNAGYTLPTNNSGFNADTHLYNMSTMSILDYRMQYQGTYAGRYDVVFIPKTSADEDDLVDALVKVFENRYTLAKTNNDVYVTTSLSVFEATVSDQAYITTSLTINGTTVTSSDTEYWVIVSRTAKASTSTNMVDKT